MLPCGVPPTSVRTITEVLAVGATRSGFAAAEFAGFCVGAVNAATVPPTQATATPRRTGRAALPV